VTPAYAKASAGLPRLNRTPVRLWRNSGIVTPAYAKASAGLPSFVWNTCSPLRKSKILIQSCSLTKDSSLSYSTRIEKLFVKIVLGLSIKTKCFKSIYLLKVIQEYSIMFFFQSSLESSINFVGI